MVIIAALMAMVVIGGDDDENRCIRNSGDSRERQTSLARRVSRNKTDHEDHRTLGIRPRCAGCGLLGGLS
jgi:hypothetical protein